MKISLSPVPSKVEDCPRVSALTAQVNKLRADEQNLDAEFSGVEAQMTAARSKATISTAAARYAETGEYKVNFDDFFQQREKVIMKREIVREARRQTESQLEQARCDASRRIAESLRPGFVEILRGVKTKIVALMAELDKERQFRIQAEDRGISLDAAGLRPMWLNEWPMVSWLESAATHYGV